MKKKALIVTVYNSHNSGSFLQAYAMYTILKKLGFDVGFYKRKIEGSSHSLKVVFVRVAKGLLSFKFVGAIHELRVWFVYRNATIIFPVYNRMSAFYRDADIMILGSDTIWNFDDMYFRNEASVYLGASFEGKHILSYAVSAANTSLETFKSVANKFGLNHLSAILVRDTYTKRLVENSSDRKALIVTDPTLLLNAEDYSVLCRKIQLTQPFLLLYYFNRISDEMQNAIKNYASKRNLKVVSIPFEREWCDLSPINSPHNMVSYYQQAECVITNTFHGCALSLIFNKPFAVHDEGKNKITDFLGIYGAKDRYFKSCNRMVELLDTPNQVKESKIYDKVQERSLNLLVEGLKFEL